LYLHAHFNTAPTFPFPFYTPEPTLFAYTYFKRKESMARYRLISEDTDKVLIPVYVICEPEICKRNTSEYKFLLEVSEDENFAGFKGMIFSKTLNVEHFDQKIEPDDQRFIHGGFYVATPAKFRDILQKHLKEKVEPHLDRRYEEYQKIHKEPEKPENMTDDEWKEQKFEDMKNFLYDKVEALNIFLTTRQKVNGQKSQREVSLMEFSLVKRKYILCNALFQNVEECYKNFKNPEDANWQSQNRRFINPEDLLTDLSFKHNVFDWSDEKEPTVVQFGELIERVADNFQQIAEMIREACDELEKEQVDVVHHPESQTNVDRRKFKVQLMMDGMRYMATLNQNLANFIVPLQKEPAPNQPRMLGYRQMQ